MALGRIKTWNAGDTLTAADLNGEFNNVLNNPFSLISAPLAVAQGGTGLITSPLTFALGGTNAITAAAARTSIGAAPTGPSLGVVPSGQVLAIKTGPVGSPAIIYAPDGTLVSTVGTTTDGLQEALNFAATNKFDLYVVGGTNSAGNGFGFSCTTSITIAASQQKTFVFRDVTISFTAAIGAASAIKIDSLGNVDIAMPGVVIVSAGTGPVVEFAPTLATPQDGVIGLYASRIRLGAVVPPIGAAATAGQPAIKFTPPGSGTTGIRGNIFEIDEINGGDIAVQVIDAAVSLFAQNQVRVGWVHGQKDTLAAQITVGTAGTNLFGNLWILSAEKESATKPLIATAENGGTYQFVGSNTVGNRPLVTFLANSTQNLALIPNITTAEVTNNATAQTNRIIRAAGPARNTITVTASPFTFTNNTTFDTVVAITGGTVSAIDLSADGATFDTVGAATGLSLSLRQGMRVRVTYSVLPTMTYYY